MLISLPLLLYTMTSKLSTCILLSTGFFSKLDGRTGGNRTRMLTEARDFKSLVSTNSTTVPDCSINIAPTGLEVKRFLYFLCQVVVSRS